MNNWDFCSLSVYLFWNKTLTASNKSILILVKDGNTKFIKSNNAWFNKNEVKLNPFLKFSLIFKYKYSESAQKNFQSSNIKGTHINSAYNHENKRLSVSSISGPVIVGGESNKCARCTKSVYAAEKVSAAGKTYHKLCFNCSTCKKLLSSMNCCDNSEGDIFCKGIFDQNTNYNH